MQFMPETRLRQPLRLLAGGGRKDVRLVSLIASVLPFRPRPISPACSFY
jgi:hypothetical protein